ncbi:MAG TPA: hypothetical protein VGT41_00555 [Candidatus Babeliales bacterium]|nr:hypothetical protein [Candidatus Babeliales bacterium]
MTALVPYTGASTTLAMGTNPVTGSGANTAGSLSLSSTTDSTSTSTGTLICAGGVGIAKSAYVGTAVYVNTTSATAKLVVSGGVQNVASEDSCIRAISSALSAKIEIQNSTAVTGRVYELRVSSTGTFDITDRSAARTPFTDNNASFGFNGGSFGSGTGVLFIANRSAAPSSNPAGGGILYCESGALKYRGSLGTVTTIANA